MAFILSDHHNDGGNEFTTICILLVGVVCHLFSSLDVPLILKDYVLPLAALGAYSVTIIKQLREFAKEKAKKKKA